ncbi:hypothetical protein FHG87_006253 [Trinorchestia longiramus]|nr:hypothetical protein FHG87_006253 [Trinorchestia longiramus]
MLTTFQNESCCTNATLLEKNADEREVESKPTSHHQELATEAGVSKTSLYRVLKEDLGKKLSKMMKRHELTEHHERMRAGRSRHVLNEIAQGTLPNLVFTVEKIFDIQHVVLPIMVWEAVTDTGRSPLVFVPCGVKLNSERYISLILESKLLPWAKKHFQGSPWSLQQDLAPSTQPKLGFRGIFHLS